MMNEELQKRRDTLETFDKMPNGAIFRSLRDVRTGILGFDYVSGNWEKMMGVTAEDSLSDAYNVFKNGHPDDLPQLMQLITKSLDPLVNFEIEMRYLHPVTKKEIWIQISSYPRREGDFIFADGFIFDITVRKKAEAELDEYREKLEFLIQERTDELTASNEELASTNEELLSTNEELERFRTQLEQMVEERTRELVESEGKQRFIFENTRELFFIQDLIKNKFTFAGGAYFEIFGYTLEELMQITDHHGVYGIVASEDIENVERLSAEFAQKYFQTGELPRFQYETRLNRKDGSVFWAAISLQLIADETGNLTRAVGIVSNIDERKKAEAELNEYREKLELLVQQRTEELTVVNEELILTNEELDRYRAQLEEFVKKLDEANMQQAATNEELEATNEELEATNEELEAANEELVSTNEELERFRTQLEQMVDEKTAELVIAKIKAEESDRLKSAFLANMSHEIRTPLNAVVGFLQIIESDSPIEQRKKYIDIIKNSSSHLLKLIDDIIDISKIEAQQMTIRHVSVELNELMNEFLLFFESYPQIMGKDHVRLILDTGGMIDRCVIQIDTVRLRQVLNNLISNALKFTEKGYIRFGYRQSAPNRLEFVVEDTGIGLSPEHQEVIFERFRQAETSSDRLYRGAGLGLTISRSLIQLMGGNMWVESTEGLGSSFYFTIPYVPVD